MNVTYSINEIDIDVKRPQINNNSEDTIIMSANANTNTNTPIPQAEKPKSHFLVEQVTIKKTVSSGQMKSSESSTQIKTIKKTTYMCQTNVPKIVVSNWDEEHESSNNSDQIDVSKDNSSPVNIVKISPKLVEEMTIDKFHQSFSSNEPDKTAPSCSDVMQTPVNKSTPKKIPVNSKSGYAIEKIDLNNNYLNEKKGDLSCDKSQSGYFVVQNTQPANIEVEVFNQTIIDASSNKKLFTDINNNMCTDETYKTIDTVDNEYYLRNCANRNIPSSSSSGSKPAEVECLKTNEKLAFENREYISVNQIEISKEKAADLMAKSNSVIVNRESYSSLVK
jgi:hypothetical protein